MTKHASTYVRERLIGEGKSLLVPGKPLVHGSLGVCPLHSEKKSRVGYLTYEEALEKETVVVTEVSEGGSVPELRLDNRGDKKVLIIDGEQLVGAKQNRILNTTVLIDAHAKVVIPVSCVEQGRWHYQGAREMGYSRAPLYARTRADKSRQVSENLQARSEYRANQSAIWTDISERLHANGVAAPSSAMDDHYESSRDRLASFDEELALENFEDIEAGTIVGAVFSLNGKILGMDTFDKARTFEKQYPKLLYSYAIEAIRSRDEGGIDLDAVREFLKSAGEAKMKTFDPPGLGKDVRIMDGEVVGSALVVSGQVIHLYAFNVKRQSGRRDRFDHSSRIVDYRIRRDGMRPPVID